MKERSYTISKNHSAFSFPSYPPRSSFKFRVSIDIGFGSYNLYLGTMSGYRGSYTLKDASADTGENRQGKRKLQDLAEEATENESVRKRITPSTSIQPSLSSAKLATTLKLMKEVNKIQKALPDLLSDFMEFQERKFGELQRAKSFCNSFGPQLMATTEMVNQSMRKFSQAGDERALLAEVSKITTAFQKLSNDLDAMDPERKSIQMKVKNEPDKHESKTDEPNKDQPNEDGPNKDESDEHASDEEELELRFIKSMLYRK